MKRLEKVWLTYRHFVIPKDAPAVQVSESRRAFYAGADGLLNEILGMLDADSEPTPADILKMEEISQELKDFALAVQNGAA
jgi:hypothetical protein